MNRKHNGYTDELAKEQMKRYEEQTAPDDEESTADKEW
jgi:hypothetical protein